MNIRVIVPARRSEIQSPVKPAPLKWLDMSSWDHAPIPERKWAIRDRVPLKQAGHILRRGRHRQEHHRADEERRSCDRKGLAGLDA